MDVLTGFRNTFAELVQDDEKTIRELSKELKTSPFVVLKWKNSYVNPKLRSLIKIADYFHCSLEFLCGKTNDDSYFEPRECPAFGERLTAVLKECRFSSYRLFKESKISPAQYQHWREGIEPLMTSLETIAECIGISLDYLTGRGD